MTPEQRALVIARDRARCVRCGRSCEYIPCSVHHRQLRQRNNNWPSNLILLCGTGTVGCHALVHSRRVDIGEPFGYIVSRYEDDPATVPVYYHRRGWTTLLADGTRLPTTDPHPTGVREQKGNT